MTIVYVLTDTERLRYYNQLMKSLYSLRIHMPDQNVCVLTDQDTYSILERNEDKTLFNIAKVIPCQIGDGYSRVEKSRYLKTISREVVSGNFLYIDTDTVICDSLPEIDSKKSVGLVLEFHRLRSEANWYLTDLWDKQSGLDLQGFEYFCNGGVIWAKDDENAHRIFRKWNQLWEKTRKNGIIRDQSPLNYVLREEFDHVEILDNTWNVQFCKPFSMGINYLSDAKILHYFNFKASAYKLCQDEYSCLPYNDIRIQEMLKHPKSQFSRSRLVKLDGNNYVDRLVADDLLKIRNSDFANMIDYLLRHPNICSVIVNGWKFIGNVKWWIRKRK